MKIKSLYTESFGKFKNEKWEEFSDSINVFYGENEAGKSTVFKMLVHLLFGFKSINREKNTLVNQETNQLNIGGLLMGNHKIQVERNLKSKASLSVVELGKQQVLENEVLESAAHIDRATYEAVYALELSKLSHFKHQTWQDIEELLIQQYSGDTFKSPKQVISLIEDEMKSIKKKSDRGNSIIKTLEEERRKLFKQKKHIQGHLELADELEEKLNRLDHKVEEVKATKLRLEHQKMLLTDYLPIMRLIDEKQVLESKLEAFKNLRSVDEFQYKEKKTQLKKMYAKLEEISESIAKYVAEKRRLSERVQSFNVTENELKDMIQKHMMSDDLLHEKETLEKSLDLKEQTFKKAFEETFDERYQMKHFEDVLSLNYLNIKSLVKEIEEIYDEIKILKRNKRSTTNGSLKGSFALMVVLAIAGGALAYFNINTYANYGGIFLIGLALTNSVHLIQKNRNKGLDEDDLYSDRDELRNRLVLELNGIKLSSIAQEFIGQEFLSQVMTLKTQAEHFLSEKAIYETKYEQMNQLDSSVESYLQEHVGEILNKAKHFDDLMTQLKESQKHISRIEVINGQLDVFNDQLLDVEKQLNEVEDWIVQTENQLKSVGDGDIAIGLEKLNSKAQDTLRLDEIIKRLSTSDYSEEVLKSFRSTYTEDKYHDLSYINTEIELITTELNELIINQGGIFKDRQLLLEQSDVANVESELKYIDERLIKEKLHYDRLMLMHHVIKETDERYRTENQPRVYQQASDYLDIITEGKYTSLEVVEVEEKSKVNYVIMVTKKDQGECQLVQVDETFSMGTLNQIYLSLRLSLIDHLDQGHEKLPVCFDELLVNWDRERLNQTLKIIETIGQHRQVFVFTCHEWFAESLKSLKGTKIYQL